MEQLPVPTPESSLQSHPHLRNMASRIRNVGGKAAAMAMTAGLAASQPNYSPNAFDTPSIAAYELSYPDLASGDEAPMVMDTEASDEHTTVYRHEGLAGLSFARPSLETTRKVLEADSLETMSQYLSPFFKSLGIDLYMTPGNIPPGMANKITPVMDKDLESARNTIMYALNEIAITPREVIKIANVGTIVFAHETRTKKGVNGGFSWQYEDHRPGIVAINITDARDYRSSNTWHHELAHQLDHALSTQPSHQFSRAHEELNPKWFSYRDKLRERKLSEAYFKMTRKKAVENKVIADNYSAEALEEDMASSYPTLWSDEMAPSPDDTSFGLPLGAKRVLWIEMLERAVPGFKKYMIGVGQAGNHQYSFLHVPVTAEAYNAIVAADGGVNERESQHITPTIASILENRLIPGVKLKPISKPNAPAVQQTELTDELTARGS